LFHLKRVQACSFRVDELYLKPEDQLNLSFPKALPVDETWYSKKGPWRWKWINWDGVFRSLTQGATLYEKKMPVKPLRQKALDAAKDWILSHQDDAGDWGGIVPAMMNSVMALYALGHSKSEPPLRKGLEAIRRLTRGVSTSIRPHASTSSGSATLQSCVSPVWDTGLAALALLENGADPKSPELQAAKDWLWSQRITRRSDWAMKAKLKADDDFAAWCFQYHNDYFPDLDDSAVTTLVLYRCGMNREELQPATRWIFSMQNRDGGWGTFDRENTQWILNEIPFADLRSLIDPSNPDVTGHILETLGEMGYGQDRRVRRAVQYLKRVQRPTGSWFGRWGVHTIYGTCAAIVGLRKVGEPIESQCIQRALEFILRSQNEDGGWGENCDNYRPQCETGVGSSTPSQTAWALMSLQACRRSSSDFQSEIQRAIGFLHSRVQDDGLLENEFTGTGFPMHFYLRYDGYRNFFPLIALGRISQN